MPQAGMNQRLGKVPDATAINSLSNPPAGGTGATAGAYDNATNRDAMIAALTAAIAEIALLKTDIAALRTHITT